MTSKVELLANAATWTAGLVRRGGADFAHELGEIARAAASQFGYGSRNSCATMSGR